MKTEDAIKKLNAHYEKDCLGVEEYKGKTYFKINIPADRFGGLSMTFRKGEINSIDQWTGYTTVNLSISNEELEAL